MVQQSQEMMGLVQVQQAGAAGPGVGRAAQGCACACRP